MDMKSLDMKSFLLAAALVSLPASTIVAQSTTYNQRHTIAGRSANQQARINKGVTDGQITPKGAARADARQSHISSEDQRMRSHDDGRLTAGDRHKLARQQDRSSQGIYNRNHNAATDPGVTPR